MSLTKKPVKGMKDILPEEMQIRDYAIHLLKETYQDFGFVPIDTPVVEHLGNLNSKEGGENEKLIFKILKRGAKLNVSNIKEENDLVDSGLRYDLTVPLCRYYSNHVDVLPSPFKAMQVGSVFRADRPQRGRFRQFTQCDIDILGEPTNLAEIELILATTTYLGKLGFEHFTVHINDRRFLLAIAAYCGFPQAQTDEVLIILDKRDKIGWDGVQAELMKEGFQEESVSLCLKLFQDMGEGLEAVQFLKETLQDQQAEDACENLLEILTAVDQLKTVDFELRFDPTLVRGMGYYTGPIFEIEMTEFGSSVGGGGRYDELIGKFTGMKVPACGFSIGFERIITILMEHGYTVPDHKVKKAYLMEKKLSTQEKLAVLGQAQQERNSGACVSVSMRNKNARFQKEQLRAEGYTDIIDVYHQEGV